jgi:hypothetical protein
VIVSWLSYNFGVGSRIGQPRLVRKSCMRIVFLTPVLSAVILGSVEYRVVTACFLHFHETMTPFSKWILDVTERQSWISRT